MNWHIIIGLIVALGLLFVAACCWSAEYDEHEGYDNKGRKIN